MSLTYSYEVAVGLSTVHGVRLGGDMWFVGGALSCSIDFMLSGTYYYRDGDFGGPLPLTLIRPGISVGYRF